ncbi:RNA-directed DNA polymerase, eukaryota, partial [Tanacetum coccineum]
MFIKSRIYLDDEYVVMTRNYFLQYTQLEIPEFHDTLIQHMEYVKKSIDKRALHKREYDSWVNERQMQTTYEKVDTSKALDASLVDTESSGTVSKVQDTSSRSGNEAHADDADIRPIYDEEPMAEVQTTAKINVFATGQHHTEQPEFNNEGEGCEREVIAAEKDSSEEFKSKCRLRLSWALVHSKRPEDVQRGIAMLEAALPSTSDPLQMREKMYLLVFGYYRSGDSSRSRQLADRCLEAITLKKSIEDRIKKDRVIGIGIAATALGAVGLVADWWCFVALSVHRRDRKNYIGLDYDLLKWVWRFISGDGSLWCKVIQAIYGSKFDLHVTDQPSIWCSILREVKSLKDSGFDFSSHCKKRIGDGSCTSFWYDIWLADAPLCVQFPHLFALELDKEIVVANKMGASSVSASFRRDVRDGAERQQWDDLSSIMNSVVLSSSKDRWTCDLSGDGEFKVKVIRNFIDDLFLPSSDVATRWVKFIPIKVNVFSWRARRDRLPTRVNLSRRGVLLDSHLCPLCNAAMEDVQHVFFRCDVARVVLRKICRWWDLDWQEICSFSDWDAWFLSFRLSSRLKSILEGVFYVAWWRIWRLRNQLVFDASPPNRSTIFDDI